MDPISALMIVGKIKKFWKLGLALVVVAALVGGALVVKGKVDKHFETVRLTQAALDAATEKNKSLVQDKKALALLNQQNAEAYDALKASAALANELAMRERDEAEARARQYRSVRDAAKSEPLEGREPVPAVVQRTIDQLWP